MSRCKIGFSAAALTMAAFGLVACGGGGGGGGPTTTVTTPPPVTPTTPVTPTFVSWSNDLKPGAVVVVSGKAQAYNVGGNSGGVTTVSAPSAVGAATFTETVNTAGIVTGVKIAAPTITLDFNTNVGDTITALNDPRVIGAVTKDQTKVAIAAEPGHLGWDYQSFGVWETTDSTNTGSGGAISVGAATAAGAVPTTGSAAFNGLAGGVYIDIDGHDHIVAANMTLTANFATRSATFTSQNMADVFETATYSGTAMSGTLTYAAGTNALTGTLTTARLSGAASGQFFGPSAQEVGGIFFLAPTGGVERLAGGFGGKR